jgi:CMP-N-acetylneuraminic acid synthetase
MISSQTVIAIITARAGSKGIPHKNIRPLAGKPLIAYTIEAALDCGYIDRVIVSTDGAEIERTSLNWGAETLHRPVHLTTDTSLSEDAVFHAIETLGEGGLFCDLTVLLQPTSPLRRGLHISEALEMFDGGDSDCLVSITETEHSPFKCFKEEDTGLVPLLGEEKLFVPRQDLPRTYRDNGAIYIVRTDYFRKNRTFYCPGFLGYRMTGADSIDIDTEFELEMAELVLRNRETESPMPPFRDRDRSVELA